MTDSEARERIAALKALVDRAQEPSDAELKDAFKMMLDLFGQLVLDTMYIASSR